MKNNENNKDQIQKKYIKNNIFILWKGKRKKKISLYFNHLSVMHSRGTNGKRTARRFRCGLVTWRMVVRRRHIHQELFLIIFIVFERLHHFLSTFIK